MSDEERSIVELHNQIEYWYEQAYYIIDLLEQSDDRISLVFQIAQKIRLQYIFGRQDMIFLQNNTPRD